MSTVREFCDFIESFAPQRLAEEWDNVGLLLGDRSRPVRNVMTCLTITPESVAEAIHRQANLIVTHHPLPFRPLKRITADNVTGAMLLKLIENRISLYSPHTSFDSAKQGINQRLAEGLGLSDIQPISRIEGDPDGLGMGRFGRAEATLAELVDRVKDLLDVDGLHCVGEMTQSVSQVAIGCGSAGQFLPSAISVGCDALVIGETNFHTCLDAKANNVALLLPGHYASERFAVEYLADLLAAEFGEVKIWPSEDEVNPLKWR